MSPHQARPTVRRAPDDVILDETWTAVPAIVPAIRHAVVAAVRRAGPPDAPTGAVELAVSEAVTNVALHAYRGRRPGPVRVRLERAAQEIHVTVEDEGAGMAPRADSPGLGLGMGLIVEACERYEVRSLRKGGTQVRMWFSRRTSAAPQAA